MKKTVLVLMMISLLPACDWFGKKTKKPSQPIKQDRVIQSFDELKVAGDFMVTLIKSEQQKLVIRAEQQMMPCVVTQVEGAELSIYVNNETIEFENPILVDVYYTDIAEIDIAGLVMLKADLLEAPQLNIFASGASQITAQVTTDRLEVEGSGSSRFNLSGSAKKQKIDLSGTVVYNGADLKSTQADIIVAGSAQVLLQGSKKIVGEISGTASVRHKKSAKVEVTSTEFSSITQVD